jgi:hypothetical protein
LKEIIKALRNKVPVEQLHMLKKEKEKEEREEKEEGKGDLISIIKRHIKEIEGKLIARILDKNYDVVKEVPVRDLVKTLKNGNVKAEVIVFDGVITQRLIDIASKKEIPCLVGVRLGSVVKMPTNVKVMTFDQL